MTKTSNLNLNVPDYRDQRWDIPVNENWNLLDNTIAGKQDVLVSGTNIKTVNGNSLLGSGDVNIADNKSITKNTSDKLQTIGVINMRSQGSAAIKFWTGTRQQYDAIASKNANTLYNITDDTDVSLTILEALYPVGSVYITTANTCPLSALINGSTWTLVSSGRVLQGADNGHAAGTTIEAGLPNITGHIDNVEYNKTSAPGSAGALFNKTKQGKGEGNGNYYHGDLQIDASRSSSIYGNSTTVQPPAYVVNIYRRTA